MKNGFICGAWDLLHPGHVHSLLYASKQCDHLIVGLHTNPKIDRIYKNKPIQTTYERYLQLSNLSYVKQIIPYDTEVDLKNILAIQNINLRFLGTDYLNEEFTGSDICNKIGIDIIYIPRYHNYSSSELRKRIKNDES
jgi:glycerol-3-phosphate cytidylyltransferase